MPRWNQEPADPFAQIVADSTTVAPDSVPPSITAKIDEINESGARWITPPLTTGVAEQLRKAVNAAARAIDRRAYVRTVEDGDTGNVILRITMGNKRSSRGDNDESADGDGAEFAESDLAGGGDPHVQEHEHAVA